MYNMKKINLQYDVPISLIETVEDNGKTFTIQGVAINATTTDNNHTFLPEELRKSVNTLLNRPLLKDHNESIDSIVGQVIEADYDELGQNLRLKVRINILVL